MRPFDKIFGVGISRTGTKSLAVALNQLGIDTVHWPTSLAAVCRHRAAVDTTVACRFKELDQMFPGSLFVYTERNADGWLKSVREHFRVFSGDFNLPNGDKQFVQEARVRIYGTLRPGENDLLKAYREHHESVMDYFRGREDRLLRMNIVDGDGWTRLCRFLAVPVVETLFPHANSTQERENRRQHLESFALRGLASSGWLSRVEAWRKDLQ